MSYSNRNIILPAEKIIAVMSYFTFGFVGFIWIIIGAVTKQNLKSFLKYHIYQSVFLAFLFFIISHVLIILLNILGYVPILNVILGAISYFLSVSIISVAWVHLSIVQIAVLLVTIYLSAGAIRGQYSYIPWVSDIIKYNVGR